MRRDERPALADGAGGETAVDRELEPDELAGKAVDGGAAEHRARLVVEVAVGRVRLEQLRNLVGEALQDAAELEVARQDLGGAKERALLADSLAVLLEQPRHVDGEAELVRDRLRERDLAGRPGARLGAVGLPQPTWFSDPHLALVGILLVGFPWISNLGFLIFLGGLQNLPKDVLDAGKLDGLSAFRRVFAIDIPLLMPQFRIVVILSGIFAVQNFIPILLLTNGGPGTATLVPGLDMYQSAFQNDQYGYGMAIGTLLFVALLIFTLVVMRTLRPRTN